MYEAHVSIVHVHEENASKIKNRYRREAIALKRILPNQSMNLFDFIRLTVINIVIDVFHAFHERKLFLNFRDIVQFRTMQFLGTYIGFRQK